MCAHTRGGTSAAASNAVGAFALALEAPLASLSNMFCMRFLNACFVLLTWRDIQHLCIETAQMINPNDSDWERTASGRLYSYRYGYGVLDAYAFVTAAQKWEVVKPQTWVINRYHAIRRREDAKEI